MVRIDWSSTAAPTATPAALELRPDVDALLAQWAATDDKFSFVASLPIAEAIALCNAVPPRPQPNRRRKPNRQED